MDFTLTQYTELLKSLQHAGYFFQTFEQFIQKPHKRGLVLRHDVDARPENSLRFARLQAEAGIGGSYYFRVVPQSYNPPIIKEIASLGHEVGYHYETMDHVSSKFQVSSSRLRSEDLIEAAYEEFCSNLEMIRKIVPVETICMHGSPRSKYDNKMIWDKYDYKSLGLIGEPYFDIDFRKVGYLTDTGRRWNGDKVSIRDKVNNPFNFNFRSTQDIINSVHQLPNQVMFTFHPQRWNSRTLPWIKEFVWQNTKNGIKYFVIKIRD